MIYAGTIFKTKIKREKISGKNFYRKSFQKEISERILNIFLSKIHKFIVRYETYRKLSKYLIVKC